MVIQFINLCTSFVQYWERLAAEEAEETKQAVTR